MVIATSNTIAPGRRSCLYRGQERAPRDGYQVHLTIDLNLQNIVENEIDAAMREYSPKKATIILMRPQTGEILAMANRPNFDLNQRSEAKPEQMKNRAIIDMMEPGSTFKIVTAAAALNEHKVRLELGDLLRKRPLEFWRTARLHDHKPFGGIKREGYSREIEQHRRGQTGASPVGEEKFYEYIRRFGFGERTGVEFPGEIPRTGSVRRNPGARLRSPASRWVTRLA